MNKEGTTYSYYRRLLVKHFKDTKKLPLNLYEYSKAYWMVSTFVEPNSRQVVEVNNTTIAWTLYGEWEHIYSNINRDEDHQ